MKIKRICETCGKEFLTKPCFIKKGQGKFCSISCGVKSRYKTPLRTECFCKVCSKKFLVYPAQIRKGGGSFCSKKCHYAYKSHTAKGGGNPNWRGGISSPQRKIYNSDAYFNWRQLCFLRDNFVCQKCGQKGGQLEVHHNKHFSKLLQEARAYMPLLTPYDAAMLYSPLWNTDNGIVLCEKCHRFKGAHSKAQNNAMANIPGVVGVGGPV